MRLRTAALALWLLPCVAHAQSEREVARQVHQAGGYADHLTLGGGPGGETTSGNAGPQGSGGSVPRPPGALPAMSEGLSSIVMYAAIAIFVVLLILILMSLRPKGHPGAAVAEKRRAIELDDSPPERWVEGDPDALAHAGRFEEAIAAALLRGLFAVGWKPEGLQKSRTAREILASVASDDGTLARLVAIEERVAFGGDEATAARWAEARPLWRALVERAS